MSANIPQRNFGDRWPWREVGVLVLWEHEMKAFFIFLIVLGASLNSELATAQKPPNRQSDRIRISYTPPTNTTHGELFRLVKEKQVLEHIKEVLSPLRLPRPLLLKIEGCGESNAWYEDDVITVCYEYIDEILQSAPQETTPAGVTRIDAIAGPIVEVFLHEAGHAVFEYFSVPVLGREEDAADQFAAYFLLQFDKSDARRLIAGAAYAYRREASKPSTKKNPFADEHGLPAQRFYNILCIAYGADSKLYADVVEKGYLPKERAEGCEDEYEQVERAITMLILPHIDQTRAKRVRAKRWFRLDAR